jgi:ATP-dependent phosphoenolpyruvate carboxykinase
MNLRVVAEKPWSAQFAGNMFLRPTKTEIEGFEPEWHIINALPASPPTLPRTAPVSTISP